MRKTVRVEDLVDINEISRRTGVKPNTLRKWRLRREDFPSPTKELSIGPVWAFSDIARYIADRLQQRVA